MAVNSGAKKYARMEHVIVAVDVVVLSVIDGKLHVLLTQTNKAEFEGQWAVPGALVGINESLDDAVVRVLKDKTGLGGILTEQLATFGAVDRDPFGRVISVAYLALVHADQHVLATTKEYDAIAWKGATRLPKMAYDHRDIVRTAVERLTARLEYTNIARGILAAEFTLTEMQDVYEQILGRELDKRNFRKKILDLELVEKTGGERRGERSRPAALYRFAEQKTRVVEVL